MDFEQRLQKAIQRGQHRADEKTRDARDKELSEEDLKRLHSQFRLTLSEHIESCLQKLPNHFPGFQYETIFGDRGWGAACSRDDLRLSGGRRDSDFSRLEMTVRPLSSYNVLDLAAKGTIGNKETFNRSHFEVLADADIDKFVELVDIWVLEYVEQYAARK